MCFLDGPSEYAVRTGGLLDAVSLDYAQLEIDVKILITNCVKSWCDHNKCKVKLHHMS